jgi:hypothetical protein
MLCSLSKSAVFWGVTLCSVVDHHLRATSIFCLQLLGLLLSPEDGGSTFL